jgi:hypothetical protein
MEAGETAPSKHLPATEGAEADSGSQLSLPDRLPGRRDETRAVSNHHSGRREQPRKGCCGTHLATRCGEMGRPVSDRATGPRHLPREPPELRLGGDPTDPRCFGTSRPRDSSGRERTSKGTQAHGRHERCIAGNGETSQRTRQWSKASKTAAPPEGACPWNPATGATEGHHELRRARGYGPDRFGGLAPHLSSPGPSR